MLGILLVFPQVAYACYNETSVQVLANQTNTSVTAWTNIFDYFCSVNEGLANTTIAINQTLMNTTATLNATSNALNTVNSTLTYRQEILNSSVNMQLLSTLDTWKNETLDGVYNYTSERFNKEKDDIYMQSANVSIAEARRVENQLDTITGNILQAKADLTYVNMTAAMLEEQMFSTVRANKPTTATYIFWGIISAVASVGITYFLLKNGKMIVVPGTRAVDEDVGRPDISRSPAAAIADTSYVARKKMLRTLKFDAIQLCGRDKGLLQKIHNDIDGGVIDSDEELTTAVEQEKAIKDASNGNERGNEIETGEHPTSGSGKRGNAGLRKKDVSGEEPR